MKIYLIIFRQRTNVKEYQYIRQFVKRFRFGGEDEGAE